MIMKENKYDEPSFFASYSEMPRSKEGLEAAGEWHELRTMLPVLAGKKCWTSAAVLAGTVAMRESKGQPRWSALICLKTCCGVHAN